MIGRVSGACLLVIWIGAVPSEAQQRPLLTEDPETIGEGLVLIEGGFEYARARLFTVSGLEGHLLRVPTLGVSVGVGPIVELQIDGVSVSRLSVTDRRPAPLSHMLDVEGDSTMSPDDLVIGTKVRVVTETAGRPAMGIRFATRLPNASNESGLGLDTTDFFATLLVGKTVQSVRIVGNVGVGILSDPTRGDRQNDVLLLGVSLARAVAQGVELVGEINGRIDTRAGMPPPGTESRSQLRFGARFTRGSIRLDGGVLAGMTSRDPDIGVTAGLTWVFQAFQLP